MWKYKKDFFSRTANPIEPQCIHAHSVVLYDLSGVFFLWFSRLPQHIGIYLKLVTYKKNSKRQGGVILYHEHLWVNGKNIVNVYGLFFLLL
jgi:hypothetical protein